MSSTGKLIAACVFGVVFLVSVGFYVRSISNVYAGIAAYEDAKKLAQDNLSNTVELARTLPIIWLVAAEIACFLAFCVALAALLVYLNSRLKTYIALLVISIVVTVASIVNIIQITTDDNLYGGFPYSDVANWYFYPRTVHGVGTGPLGLAALITFSILVHKARKA